MKQTSVRLLLIILCLISLHNFNFALAQKSDELSIEWIFGQESRQVTALPAIVWLEDGTLIFYDSSKPDSKRTFEKLYPKTGKRIAILDQKQALASARQLLGEEDAPRSITFPLAFDAKGKHAVYDLNGDVFLLNLKAARYAQVTKTEAEEKNINFSPDGSKLAYVRDNDLYVYHLESGIETRLTTDGSDTILNGTLSWVYWEEVFGRQDIGYWWSDDSKAIAFLQTDDSPVSEMSYVDFKPKVPKVHNQRYPKAGDKNPIVRVGVVEISNPKPTWVDINDATYEYIARVKWLPDNNRFSVQTMNRGQTELDLYFVDRYSGKSTFIFKETDPAWVNIHDDLYFIKNGEEFIWASERSGYAHLYRYAKDGVLVNPITQGDWAIHASSGIYWLRQAVVAIDEKSQWIYFTALQKSSIERQLYRIKFDGTNMERLSREDGVHIITFSPDAKYYSDRFSNVTTLPGLTLHRPDGTLIQPLGKSRPELTAKFEIQTPELFTIATRDGFRLPASILKPNNFDPTKKYPIILNVYGGPSAPTVINSWNGAIYFDQILLNHGFLVASVDNRSATAISKILENKILLKAGGEGELNDLLDAVSWFKSQAWIDPDRIGIWGWSGGGTFTLNAMTHSADFKAGIAVAAVTDWHYYDTKWAEAAMKRPEDNPEGYEKTSLVKSAKNLAGRLLLVHGTYDDNVHIQNAWAFADEVIKAGKTFDMMIYPMRQHGISDRPARIHLYKTMLEFWKDNL